MGFRVKTGNVIWNENRLLLTDEPAGAVPLIWSRNISGTGLKLKYEPGRPQYIKMKNPLRGPVIVVNRITGIAGRQELKAALVPSGMEFAAENHVNVIFPPAGTSQKILKNILRQLVSMDSRKILQAITGNTQLSKTELELLFPIQK
jgi:adenine-specific DNA-methyltransferase